MMIHNTWKQNKGFLLDFKYHIDTFQTRLLVPLKSPLRSFSTILTSRGFCVLLGFCLVTWFDTFLGTGWKFAPGIGGSFRPFIETELTVQVSGSFWIVLSSDSAMLSSLQESSSARGLYKFWEGGSGNASISWSISANDSSWLVKVGVDSICGFVLG